MKKIIGLVVAIAVVLSLIGSGTWALFSDTEQSTGNQFTAGVIDIQVDCDGDTEFLAQDDGATSDDDSTTSLPKIFDYLPAGDIKPGASGEVTLSLELTDDSNNADIWMRVNNLTNYGGLNPEPEQIAESGGVDDAIASEINVKIWLDDGDNILNGDEEYYFEGTLQGWVDAIDALTDDKWIVQENAVGGNTTGSSTTYYVAWSWELPTSVGNEHQGDYCTFDIIFGADQLTP